MPDSAAIEAEGLRKSYGDVEALNGIDLRVPAGTVLGLLGPYGAGKTTAVRILTTLLPPDGGSARVAGLDVATEAPELRKRIGLAGQYAAVDENLTGAENLEMVGRLYHLPKGEPRARATELLDRFDLSDAASRLVRTYSGGRPAQPPRPLEDDRRPRRRRHHGPAHHPVPRRGRRPRRPHLRDRPRPRHRRGQLRRAQGPGRRRIPPE